MEQDWEAVAHALRDRLDELGMTQTDLATKSKVSLTTVRELVQNLNARRRNPRTLEAVSDAVAWPPDYLLNVLRRKDAKPYADETNDPVLRELDSVQDQLREIKTRLDSVEQRLAVEDDQS